MKKRLIDTFPDFHDYLIEKLRNPKFAKRYLELAFEEYEEDHDKQAFVQALMDIEEAQGGFLAYQQFINRQLAKPAKSKARVAKGMNGGEARV